MHISWTDFKMVLAATQNSFLCVKDTAQVNYYLLMGKLECILPINGSEDTIDFETNYQSLANKTKKNTVLTEPANISITLYNSSDVITVGANSNENIDFYIEQQDTEPQQILYGGALHAQNPDFGDYVTFQVIDIDNVLGYGANVVIKEYIVKAYLNNHGTFEDYDDAGAYLPVGLYLRCIYHNVKTEGSTKVKINYLLGIPN